jgi:hypothetical protein
MGLGHILFMGIQNNWRNQMVAENQSSSSYINYLKPSDSDYNRCIPNSMESNIPNSGTKYIDKKKSQKQKNQMILFNKLTTSK